MINSTVSVYTVFNGKETLLLESDTYGVYQVVLENGIKGDTKRLEQLKNKLLTTPHKELDQLLVDIKVTTLRIRELQTGLQAINDSNLDRRFSDMVLKGEYYHFYVNHH
jgi:hypothetical protein